MIQAIVHAINIDCVYLQAYCLKVKEMDDEEYEAAVSPLFTCANVLYVCSPTSASICRTLVNVVPHRELVLGSSVLKELYLTF